MNLEKLIFSITIALVACIATAQVSVTVNVPTAGGLGAAIKTAGGNKATVTNLTVIGNIDARDFKFMRDSMPVIATIDMKTVNIKAYSGTEGTTDSQVSASYPANKIPDKAFFIDVYTNGVWGKRTLKSFVFPDNLAAIGSDAFNQTGLTGNLELPNSITTIGEFAFSYCTGLTGDLIIPKTVTTIKAGTFIYCSNLKGKLVIPSSVTSISQSFGNSGFSGELIIPSSVTTIMADAFAGDNFFIGNLIIPSSISAIEWRTFGFCPGFSACYIPSSVNSIKALAFVDCIGLRKIAVNKTTPIVIDTTTFSGVNKTTCELIVPKGSKAAYQAATGWKLFANITEAIFVSLNTQGGNPAFPITTNLSNSTIAEPSIPIREGYTFAGWYKDAACNNAWNFAADVVTSPITLYAKWSANPVNSFTVNFNVDGGSIVAYINATNNTSVTKPADPTKTGYTFAGWCKEAACTNAWSFATDVVTGNIILYAKWIINAYTITFNSDGGSEVTNLTANYNSFINEPVPTTKTGYAFAGWYKETTCANAWNFATDVVKSNITLFAKWTAVTFVENKQVVDFKLYPNPARDKLYINLNSSIISGSIFDLQGKRVVEIITGATQIDISNLSKGVYLAKIITLEHTFVEKLIKE
jgi:uncharacterized repeat protein (TIGR02543 family)